MHISNGEIVTGEARRTEKSSKLIIVGIIICIIMIIAIGSVIFYMQSSILKIYVDGVSKNVPEELFIVDQSTGEMSVSLLDLAKLLGYQYNNGEYNELSEDTNKCYIQTEYETASFFTNSNIIYKSPITKEKNTYEYYDLGDIVRKDESTGKLYTNEKGAELGCDITIDYDTKKNTIQIFTLPYLAQYYETEVTQWGYVSGFTNSEKVTQEDIENQKALLYGMIIVKRNEESEKLGVINTKKEEIIGLKYDELTYNENTDEFFAYDDNNVGLLSSKGETLIPTKYEEIDVLDKEIGLYVVTTSDSKKGVVNKSGEYVIYVEYDEIGIDASDFKNDKIVNQYLLMDEVIPVQQNKKWGLFDKNGNMILPTEYDEIGCKGKNANDKEPTNSLLIIPNYKGIVLGKNDKYGIYNTKGVELVQCALDSAYSTSRSGINTYYMVYNGQVMNIAEYLNKFMPETTKQQNRDSEKTDEQQSSEGQNDGQQGEEQQYSEQPSEQQEQQPEEQQSDEEY